MNVWQDGLSVLPLFRYASERLQVKYRDILAHALHVLHDSPCFEQQLEGMYSEIGEHVARLESEKLSCAIILKGALQLTEQESLLADNKVI